MDRIQIAIGRIEFEIGKIELKISEFLSGFFFVFFFFEIGEMDSNNISISGNPR